MVTNARSPGSKCYGLVTMSSSAEVTRCISHLDCTELHGQQIYVERVSFEQTFYFQRNFCLILPFLVFFGKFMSLCHLSFTADVFKAKSDPFKKESSKKEAEDKSSDKRSSIGMKMANK